MPCPPRLLSAALCDGYAFLYLYFAEKNIFKEGAKHVLKEIPNDLLLRRKA